MKKIILVCALTFSLISIARSQVEFGLKAGLNSVDLVTNSIKFEDEGTQFDLAFRDSKYGHHFGLYSRIKFLGMYVEPGLLFNSNKISYTLTEYSEEGVIETIKNETYRNLDIPVLVGLKAGIIRLYAGPVAHLHINSGSDLFDIRGYDQRFKDATYGYQAGFGLDIWKLRFDLTYEGNLTKFGDHIVIDGHPYSFGDPASRIMGSLSYAF